MRSGFKSVDNLMDDIRTGKAPAAKQDRDGLAFRTGQTDREFGLHDNPFLMPHNRIEWERGYQRGPSK